MTTIAKRPHGNLKLNDSMIEALSTVIAKGNYYITACKLCEISEPTFYGWINQAELDDANGLTEEESIYIRLVKSLKKAEAQAEASFLAVVEDSAQVKKEWLPAMTFLERRHPERWGRKDRTQQGVNVNINIEKALIDASGKMEEALARLSERTEEYELEQSETGALLEAEPGALSEPDVT